MALRAQPLQMGLKQITGLADAVDANDAVNKSQLDAVAAMALSGTVTSVTVSGGTTGLTTSGGPITTSGTITMAGTLIVANGGTGLTTLTANNVILGNGTGTPTFVAPGTSGNVLTSNGTTWQSTAPSGSWTLLKKTSDQNFTSTTTLADITGLTFSVAANTTYFIRAYIPTKTAASAGGIKLGINGPSSPTLVHANYATGTGGYTYGATLTSAPSQAQDIYLVYELYIWIKNGANAGTVAIQMAQFSSNAASTVAYAGSYLEYAIIA